MDLTLWERARLAKRRALARGALGPIATEEHLVMDGDARFSVRVVSSLDAKERAARARPSGANPFLPHDPDLSLGEIAPAHLLLLNKFPVIDDHLLLVTRAFEDQRDRLTEADFAALFDAMAGDGALAFYNAGEIAGASQAHKHLQLVPRDALTIEARIRAGALPFVHTLADRPNDPSAAHARYLELMKRAGIEERAAYNLLVTNEWMLVIPRTKERFESISINALGFAGSLLVKNAAELARIRAVGPMNVLRAVTR